MKEQVLKFSQEEFNVKLFQEMNIEKIIRNLKKLLYIMVTNGA